MGEKERIGERKEKKLRFLWIFAILKNCNMGLRAWLFTNFLHTWRSSMRQDPDALLTLSLEARPGADSWEIGVRFGTTAEIQRGVILGTDSTGPQFLAGRNGFPKARAVQVFKLPLSFEEVCAFPGVAHVEGLRTMPGNQAVFEKLATAVAQLSVDMFVACLCTDSTLLERTIRIATKNRPPYTSLD